MCESGKPCEGIEAIPDTFTTRGGRVLHLDKHQIADGMGSMVVRPDDGKPVSKDEHKELFDYLETMGIGAGDSDNDSLADVLMRLGSGKGGKHMSALSSLGDVLTAGSLAVKLLDTMIDKKTLPAEHFSDAHNIIVGHSIAMKEGLHAMQTIADRHGSQDGDRHDKIRHGLRKLMGGEAGEPPAEVVDALVEMIKRGKVKSAA